MYSNKTELDRHVCDSLTDIKVKKTVLVKLWAIGHLCFELLRLYLETDTTNLVFS